MHVVSTERVEPASYQLKGTARTWFDQWKEGTNEDSLPASWACFEEAFLSCFFPQELREAKVHEYLTLKQDYLSVHDYGLKFTQLSHYALEIVKNMRNNMSFLVSRLGRFSRKEGRARNDYW